MKVSFSEKEIQEILKSLDYENREIIFSKNVYLKLKDLIENYNISLKQKKLFLKIVGMVALEKIKKEDLCAFLELNLDVEEKEAKNLFIEIEKILELGAVEARNKKIKERKVFEKEKEEEKEVIFEKPIKNFNRKDSYRESLD